MSGLQAPRRRSERGSEIVQSAVAVSLVLGVVFAVVQAGGMMLSLNRLTADLTRACRQMDTAGLVLAADKERFVAQEILGAATQLKSESLQVSGVRMSDAGEMRSTLAKGASGFSRSHQPASEATAGVAQQTDAVRVSFDVSYELPTVAAVPGLAHRFITRHVVCEHMEGRIVEVQVAP